MDDLNGGSRVPLDADQQARLELAETAFKGLASLAAQLPPWVDSVTAAANRIAELFARVGAEIERARAPLLEMFTEIARNLAMVERLEEAGWLPHPTTPFDQLHGIEDRQAISEVIEQHYRQNWPEIRASFLARVQGYGLGPDTVVSVEEALAAHDAGLYRATPLILFSELERAAREGFYDSRPDARLTSQETLREVAGKLPLGVVAADGAAAMTLFTRLCEHLYDYASTPEAVDRFAADPVPNRHAAMHGLVVYRSAQSSLNALIMADFAFQIIAAAKSQGLEAQA